MDFYTIVLRKSMDKWVALCLENGIVGQGDDKEQAVLRLKEAICSVEEAKKDDSKIFNEPLSIKELHEFLTIEGTAPVKESLELRAVYA